MTPDNSEPLLISGPLPKKSYNNLDEFTQDLAKVLRIPYDTISVIKGAKGEIGERGQRGNAGPTGAVGAAGATTILANIPLSNIPILDATAHAADQIDSRIAGLPANNATKSIFSTSTHVGTLSYVRSTTCWARTYDLTPLGVWNSQSATLLGFTAITSRHVVICHHAIIANNTILRWVTAGNVIVERTLLNSVQVGATDLRIGLLSAPLPDSIIPIKLLPADSDSWITLAGYNALATDQENKALVTGISTATAAAFGIAAPIALPASAFYETIITGDSGKALALVHEGSLTLIGIFFTATVATRVGGNHLAGILSAIATLGGGQTPAYLKNPALKLPVQQLHSVSPLANASPVAGIDGKLANGWIPAPLGVTGLPVVTFDAPTYNGIPASNSIGQFYYNAGADDYAIAIRNAVGEVSIIRFYPEDFIPLGNGASPSFASLTLTGSITWIGAGAAAFRATTRKNLFTGTPAYADAATAIGDATLLSGSPFTITGSTALHLKP